MKLTTNVLIIFLKVSITTTDGTGFIQLSTFYRVTVEEEGALIVNSGSVEIIQTTAYKSKLKALL